jgi:hypothetical protein
MWNGHTRDGAHEVHPHHRGSDAQETRIDAWCVGDEHVSYSWCHPPHTQSIRFVQKVETCTGDRICVIADRPCNALAHHLDRVDPHVW